jgi:hypothetical protein
MPMTVPAGVPMMMVPTNLRGLRSAILDRRHGAGAAQRHCLSLLSGSGQNEQCADGRKPQNFRHLHGYSPIVLGSHVYAEKTESIGRPARRRS